MIEHYQRCKYYAMCVAVVLITFCSDQAISIRCYECSSSRDVHCTETIDVRTTNLPLTNCSYLLNPSFCVKTTGMFKGEVGTTRFCSSENFGNLCDLQTRMGDVRQYRSCFHTCSTDGCNAASTITLSVSFYTLAILLIFVNLLFSKMY